MVSCFSTYPYADLGGSVALRCVTVSAKIPAELKERMEELDINVSRVIRRALEEGVRRRELERLKELVEEAAEAFRKIPEDYSLT